MKYHLDRAINVITRIESEHLDYSAQMKRLEDVASRFAPLMHRLDTNLPSIQQELGLPAFNTQLNDHDNHNLFQKPLLLPDFSEEKCDEIERKSSPKIFLLEDENLEDNSGHQSGSGERNLNSKSETIEVPDKLNSGSSVCHIS